MVVLAERIPTCERELARNELVGFAGPALLARESDERLVALVRDGDENAFAAIVARYRQPLERHCRRTLSPSRAEDALQQTFAKAYVALSEGAQPGALRAWLYAIAHNTAVNGLRDRQSESLEAAGEYGVHQQTHEIVAGRESLRSVVRAVVGLPARQRQVLVRQEFEGATQEQIAAELGLSTGAVRQLAHRARSTVRAAAGALIPAPLWRLLPWQLGCTGGGDVALNSAFAAVIGKTAVVLLMATAAGGAVELTTGIPSASAPSHSRVAAPRAPAAKGAVVTGAGRSRTVSGGLGTAGAPATSHRGSATRPGGTAAVDAHGGIGAGATSSVEGPGGGQLDAPAAGSGAGSGSAAASGQQHGSGGSGVAGTSADPSGRAGGDHQEASASDAPDPPESSSSDIAADAVEIDLPVADEPSAPDAPDVVEPDTGAPSANRGSTAAAATVPTPPATSGSSG